MLSGGKPFSVPILTKNDDVVCRHCACVNQLWYDKDYKDVSTILSYFESYLGFGFTEVDTINSETTIYVVCTTQPKPCLATLRVRASVGMVLLLTLKAGIFQPASEELYSIYPTITNRVLDYFAMHVEQYRYQSCIINDNDMVWYARSSYDLRLVNYQKSCQIRHTSHKTVPNK